MTKLTLEQAKDESKWTPLSIPSLRELYLCVSENILSIQELALTRFKLSSLADIFSGYSGSWVLCGRNRDLPPPRTTCNIHMFKETGQPGTAHHAMKEKQCGALH